MSDDRQSAAAALVTLRTRVDDHFGAVQRRHPSEMSCRAGCDSCCHVRLSVFRIEAERIEHALAALDASDPARRARVRQQADDPAHAGRCAMLLDGHCAVYDERPMICRTHGLPTLVEGRVDVCPLNFTGGVTDGKSVVNIDVINQPLAVIATLWSGDGERVDLADLARS